VGSAQDGGPRGADDSWRPPKRPGLVRRLVRRQRTSIARRRNPDRVARALSSLPMRLPPPPWVPEGWATGAPDFVGVGVQRAGTSRWFGLISAHPGVSIHPDSAKEAHFFDRLNLDALDADRFAAEYARWFPRLPGTLTGEWTPEYISSFWAIPLLARAAPDAKLLVSLRDPIDRYASAIARLRRKSGEQGGWIWGGDLTDAAARSRYAEQLEHLFEHFPREQVLILQYERCRDDPAPELARTWEFLGLDPVRLPAGLIDARVNSLGEHPVLEREVVDALADWLAPDIARLGELVPELDLGLWTSWSEAVARTRSSDPPRP